MMVARVGMFSQIESLLKKNIIAVSCVKIQEGQLLLSAVIFVVIELL